MKFRWSSVAATPGETVTLNNRVTEDDGDTQGPGGFSGFISSASDESAAIVADLMPVAGRKKSAVAKVDE
jgi:hypothetical protein